MDTKNYIFNTLLFKRSYMFITLQISTEKEAETEEEYEYELNYENYEEILYEDED